MKRVVNHYLNAYRGLPRDAWILSTILLINRSGSMVIFFMTLYLTQKLDYSVTDAGLMLTWYGLGSMAGALAGGAFTDRIGARAVQITALLGGGICFIVLAYLRSKPAISLMLFAAALTSESLRPANAAALMQVCPPELRPRGFGLGRLAINLGVAIGPALGGFLATYNYIYLFWIDGLTCLSAGLFAWFFLPPHRPAALAGDIPPPPGLLRDRTTLLVIALGFFCSFIFRQLFVTWPVYIRTVELLGESHIGLMMALNAVIIVLVEMPILHSLERARPPVIMAGGALLIGLGFALLPLGSGSGFIAFTVVIWTFGEILFFPQIGAYIATRATDRNRGRYMGMLNLAFAFAFVVSAPVGSYIYSHLGSAVLWQIVGMLGVVSAAGMLILNRRSAAGNTSA